jgi:hypothetical protein
MLALTHHVLVQVCAHTVGKTLPFTGYSVLGDDIVIVDDLVAAQYRALMTQLGVSISEGKSLISSEIGEFAKRLISPKGDFTPIGPGLLLQAHRDKVFLAGVVKDALRLGFLPISDTVHTLIERLAPHMGRSLQLILQLIFGVSGIYHNHSHLSVFSLRWCSMEGPDPDLVVTWVIQALALVARPRVREDWERQKEAEVHFYQNWWKVHGSDLPGRAAALYGALLVFLSPAFWFYALSLSEGVKRLDQRFDALIKVIALRCSGVPSREVIPELDKFLSMGSITTIDWRDKSQVKAFAKLTKDIVRMYESRVQQAKSYLGSW